MSDVYTVVVSVDNEPKTITNGKNSLLSKSEAVRIIENTIAERSVEDHSILVLKNGSPIKWKYKVSLL